MQNSQWAVRSSRATVGRTSRKIIEQPGPASTPKVTAATPFYKSWWFWTVIAGVTAGGAAATTAVLLTRPAATTGTLCEIRGVSP